MIVILLLGAVLVVLAVLGLWVRRVLRRLGLAEVERRTTVAWQQQQRERAQAVLAGRVAPAPEENVPVPLGTGEAAYYVAPAAELQQLDDGSFQRLAQGQIVVTNRAVYLVENDAVRRRQPIRQVERVDIPFGNVVTTVSFRDTLLREEERLHFEVGEPLVVAAHISRFTAFQLILN